VDTSGSVAIVQSSFFEELSLLASASPTSEVLFAPDCPPVTLATLISRIYAVASLLRTAHLTSTDVVAVILPDGPELLSIVLGVASSAICAPVNPAFRHTEMTSCLRALGARAVIVDPLNSSPGKDAARELGIPVLNARQAQSTSVTVLQP
jgi:acyl-coenzyme A synthetase/AMP-(fatty) acid ligase